MYFKVLPTAPFVSSSKFWGRNIGLQANVTFSGKAQARGQNLQMSNACFNRPSVSIHTLWLVVAQLL